MRMFSALIAVAVVAIAVLLWVIVGRDLPLPRDSETPLRSSPVSLEEKLAVLRDCGLELAPPFTTESLLESWPRADYEEPGFDRVLVALGMTEERPPWRPHCLNLWHFDTECIEGDGSYTEIARRLASMTNGALQLDNLVDHVDIDLGEAWLRFDCRGQHYSMDCEVDHDWVDAKLFSHFVELLAKEDPQKVFIYYDLGGQDCMIGCVACRQFEKLRELIPKFELLA